MSSSRSARERHRAGAPGGAGAGRSRPGFSLVDQTKMVTAASELARNTLEHGGGGTARLELLADGGRARPAADLRGPGPGIADIELALTDGYTSRQRPGARPRRRPAAGERVRASTPRRARAPGSRSPGGSDAGARSQPALPVQRRRARSATARRAAVTLAERAGRSTRPSGARWRWWSPSSPPTWCGTRGGGELLVAPLARRAGGLEIVAIDRGPGMADVGRSAAGRLLDRRHATARAWARCGGSRTGARSSRPRARAPRSSPGSGSRDGRAGRGAGGRRRVAWPSRARRTVATPGAGRRRPTGGSCCVADGLGHGPDAAGAAAEAVRDSSGTRGSRPPTSWPPRTRPCATPAAPRSAIAEVRPAAGSSTFTGVGNIGGDVLSGERAAQPRCRTPASWATSAGRSRTFSYPWPERIGDGAALGRAADAAGPSTATRRCAPARPRAARRRALPGLRPRTRRRDRRRGPRGGPPHDHPDPHDRASAPSTTSCWRASARGRSPRLLGFDAPGADPDRDGGLGDRAQRLPVRRRAARSPSSSEPSRPAARQGARPGPGHRPAERRARRALSLVDRHGARACSAPAG